MKGKNLGLCAGVVVGLMVLQPLCAETNMSLSIVPGKNWETTTWFAIFPMKHAPQLAVWIEDGSGSFVKTVTVTGSSAHNKWTGNPENGRPEALPVWKHKVSLPAGAVDAASSATPGRGIELAQQDDGLVPGNSYTVFLEVNTSFDYNAAWPKNAKKGSQGYSGVNGQPSLVYKASFVAGTPCIVTLGPFGTGSIDGSTGDIHPGLDGMTTALTMIGSATLVLK